MYVITSLLSWGPEKLLIETCLGSFCGLEFQWNIKPYEREEQAKAAKAAEKAKAERAARAAEKAKEAEEIEYSAGESDVSMD